MFNRISEVDFPALNVLSFSRPAYTTHFQGFFRRSKDILDVFGKIAEFEEYISDDIKEVLESDCGILVEILLSISSGVIKQPDDRIMEESFSDEYLSELREKLGVFEHFSRITDENKKSHSEELAALAKSLDDSDKASAEALKKKQDSIDELVESHSKELAEKEEELNKIAAERDYLESEKSRLNLEIQKKELNKLAKAFEVGEGKYSAEPIFWIYLGFLALMIPSLFVIYLILSETIKDIPFFDILNISGFDWYDFIPFGVLVLTLWYVQYFQLKNFYINKDIRANFANRKAIADSFKGLLEMINEDGGSSLSGNKTELISGFIDKASSVLYSEIDTSYIKKHEDNIPATKVMDILVELAKK